MLGTSVNAAAIVIGALLGLLIGKHIQERYSDLIVKGLSLAILAMGVDGAINANNMLVVVVSIAIGAVVGEWIDVEKRLENLGLAIESRFASKNPIAQGFVTATLLFCTGSMAILGAIQGGLLGDHQTLFIKSILDGVISVIFAATLGIGVVLSSVSVFLYQGTIAISASFLQNVLTDVVIQDLSAVGGALLIGLGLKMLGAIELKVGNLIPALFVPVLIYPLLSLM
ncbi:MAG: DUF554 domain-containing protein [Clostridia bacterium]|nr:DUF554 domain-containing protein [Clostridia bacterium]